MGCSDAEVMPALSNQAVARREASISTGRVMKLNNVVRANNTTPTNSMPGMECINMMPASSTHCTQLEANETTGTRAERMVSGAYATACCTA